MSKKKKKILIIRHVKQIALIERLQYIYTENKNYKKSEMPLKDNEKVIRK